MPARADHLHIGVLQTAFDHRLVQQRLQTLAVEREGHPQLGDGREKAVQVPVETKKAIFPDMHHVIGRIGAQKAPV